MHRTTLFALAACFVGSAAAQSAARPDVTDPKAPVPASQYESAFRGYRTYVDPEIAGWRAVNDEVGRLNGHVGHVPAPPKPGAKPPAPMGHGAHK